MTKKQIATNNIGRVFVQKQTDMLGCCPTYYNATGVSGLSQNREAAIRIQAPSDTNSGQYDLRQKIPGQLEFVTFDLTGYVGLDGISPLREIFQENCDAIVHIHYGQCNNPSDFRNFEKALVFDGVSFTSYTTDNLIALDSSGKAAIIETASAEADRMYEYFSEKKFSLVGATNSTTPIDIHLINSGCNLCVFCADCSKLDCSQDFYSIPQDDAMVLSFNDGIYVYTIEEAGLIKVWDYESISSGILSCSIIHTIELDENEIVISASYNQSANVLLVGTSDGNIYYYDVRLNQQSLSYSGQNEISKITSNEHGYLFADSVGQIFYSSDAEFWDAPTTTGAGTVQALHLYSEKSWIVSVTSGLIYYTNDSGLNYLTKKYRSVANEYIKQFAQSNRSILHAISDTRYHQTFDGGCNWNAIDLNKYFSEIYSMEVCPTNPFIVYLAGLNVAGDNNYIIKINFGA